MLDWGRLKVATKTTKAVIWLLFWFWPICVLGWGGIAALSALTYWWTGSLLSVGLAAYAMLKFIGTVVFAVTYFWSKPQNKNHR